MSMKQGKTLALSLLGIGILLLIVVDLWYGLYGRGLVELVYQDEAPAWFRQTVEFFYPRFNTEKHRFDFYFFLEKADQVIWRANLCSILLGLLVILFYGNSHLRTKVKDFWSQSTSRKNIRVLRILCLLFLFYFTWDWIYLLQGRLAIVDLYHPVFLLQVLHLPYPSLEFIYIGCILMWLSALMVLLGWRDVFFSSMLAILFILLQGYLYSFHKLDHTFATFNYGLLLLPFLLWECQRVKSTPAPPAAWPISLAQWMVVSAYFLAGLEKILIGGGAWFAPETMATYLRLHAVPWGIWVADHPILCVFLAVMGVLFELAFCLIMFLPRYKYVFLLAGLFFHWGNYVLLEVGGWVHPWIVMYIFFIDWGRISMQLADRS